MTNQRYFLRALVAAFLLTTYGVVSYSLWELAAVGGTAFLVLAIVTLILPVAASIAFLAFRSHWAWLVALIETILVTELFLVIGITVLLQLIDLGFKAPLATFGDYLYVFGPPVFMVLGAALVSMLITNPYLGKRQQ